MNRLSFAPLGRRGLWNASPPIAAGCPAPVFIYHSVAPNHAAHDPGDGYLLSAQQFAQHLSVVRRSGLPAVRLGDDLLSASDACALTFDDGCAEWHRRVAPALAELALPATFLLIADPAARASGSRASSDPLTPRMLRDLAQARDPSGRALFEIGSHGLNHVDLGALLERHGPQAVLDELRESRRRIEDAVGLPCRVVSLPGGKKGRRPETASVLRRLAAEAGFQRVRDSQPRYHRDPRRDFLGGSPVYAATTAAMVRFELRRLRRTNWANAAHWTGLRLSGQWREVPPTSRPPAPGDSAANMLSAPSGGTAP